MTRRSKFGFATNFTAYFSLVTSRTPASFNKVDTMEHLWRFTKSVRKGLKSISSLLPAHIFFVFCGCEGVQGWHLIEVDSLEAAGRQVFSPATSIYLFRIHIYQVVGGLAGVIPVDKWVIDFAVPLRRDRDPILDSLFEHQEHIRVREDFQHTIVGKIQGFEILHDVELKELRAVVPEVNRTSRRPRAHPSSDTSRDTLSCSCC